MGRAKKENPVIDGMELDDDEINKLPLKEVEKTQTEDDYEEHPTTKFLKKNEEDKQLVSCLKNVRITVRHIPKLNGMITNPRHVLYGGMAENAKRTFVVPKLSSGSYVNVLTNSEKSFLESALGLPKDALSIYNKKDNFWSDANPDGISSVTLYKQDNFLNLADPTDYIKYKILLANKDFICPSINDLQDKPKATYQYVLLSNDEEIQVSQKNVSTTMMCYKEFGKIEDDKDKLKLIIEILTGKKLAKEVKLGYLQTQINSQIQANNKMFLKIVKDPLLNTKVLIKKAVENGLIADRGGQFYIKDGNIPMCNEGEPTFTMAAQYLNEPKHQEIKFSIEAKLK